MSVIAIENHHYNLCRLRVLLLGLLLVSGNVAAAQMGRAPQGFAGCYQLNVKGLHPAKTYGDQFLPKRFQLTTRPLKEGFVVRNLDPSVRWDLPLAFWDVKNESRLEITWSTGFVGWEIQLVGSYTAGLRGTARFFTDTDLHPSRAKSVVVHAVDCESRTN